MDDCLNMHAYRHGYRHGHGRGRMGRARPSLAREGEGRAAHHIRHVVQQTERDLVRKNRAQGQALRWGGNHVLVQRVEVLAAHHLDRQLDVGRGGDALESSNAATVRVKPALLLKPDLLLVLPISNIYRMSQRHKSVGPSKRRYEAGMTGTLPLLQNETGSTWQHAEPGSGIVDEAWHRDNVVALTLLPRCFENKGGGRFTVSTRNDVLDINTGRR